MAYIVMAGEVRRPVRRTRLNSYGLNSYGLQAKFVGLCGVLVERTDWSVRAVHHLHSSLIIRYFQAVHGSHGVLVVFEG